MRTHMARRGALTAIALIVLIGTIAWTRMHDQPTPGTILLDVNPQGVAVDTRAGRAFIANTGLNNSGRTVSVLDSRTGRLIQTVTVGRSPSSVAVNEQTACLSPTAAIKMDQGRTTGASPSWTREAGAWYVARRQRAPRCS